ncbi:MAG: SRPBCC domain-containing protein [Gammaproteobacteria bacterium]|jgi:carbon monoxide dehydrogenase subunit G
MMIKPFESINRSRNKPGKRTTRISGRFTLPLERRLVWSALNDPKVLEYCIRGCERVSIDDSGEYHAEFDFGVGPIRKKLLARLTVEEVSPPAHYALNSVLITRRMGKASGRALVMLDEMERGTQLDYAADIIVDGWFAILGEDALHAAAGRYMGLFFERFVYLVEQA